MIRTQVPKPLPGEREGQGGGSKEDVRRGATAREAIEKNGVSGSLRRRSKEMTNSNTFSP